MLISTYTIVALRCSKCGKIELYSLSRFSCGKQGQVELFCECGNCLMVLTRQGRSLYYLQTSCLLCEKKHVFKMQGKEIWNKYICSLICENTGVGLAYLGQKEKVRQAIKEEHRSLEKLVQELGFEEYFINPNVMFSVLECLRETIKKGQAYCSCGSGNLTTEVFPARVELCCPYCHAIGIVFAETANDLQKLQAMQGIELEAHSCRYLDENRLKKKG
ncbi:MAG TPA: hypothetical protein GX532_06910 [Clostridia bacterium]|jgi:hypothetical protein|nr:hypothetical protein [Clostridia bacterium]HHY06684.1 hypothetical protein [Clostridia bacterium]